MSAATPLGFIPIGTKIYLKNKELVKVEDLKFGDEVLSIKILDDSIKNSFDMHCKYLKPKNTEIIDIDKIQLSSSYITNIKFSGYSDKDTYLINNIDYVDKNQMMLIMEVLEDDKRIKIKTANTLDLSAISYNKYSGSLEKDIKTDTKDFIVFDNKINSCILASDKIPLFSMSLLDNEFYITENLILFSRSI